VRSESDLRTSARDMIAARCRCPPAHPMPEKRPQKREDPGWSCSPKITTRGSELDGYSDIRMSDVAGCRFPRIIHVACRFGERWHRPILPPVKRLRIPAKIRGAAGFLLSSDRAGVGSIGVRRLRSITGRQDRSPWGCRRTCWRTGARHRPPDNRGGGKVRGIGAPRVSSIARDIAAVSLSTPGWEPSFYLRSRKGVEK